MSPGISCRTQAKPFTAWPSPDHRDGFRKEHALWYRPRTWEKKSAKWVLKAKLYHSAKFLGKSFSLHIRWEYGAMNPRSIPTILPRGDSRMRMKKSREEAQLSKLKPQAGTRESVVLKPILLNPVVSGAVDNENHYWKQTSQSQFIVQILKHIWSDQS